MKTMLTYSMIMLGITLSFLTVNAQERETVFFEDFESGWGSWYADNGVWEVGNPTVGPQDSHSGQNCVGTDLDGPYPNYADTRLISPTINLPTLNGDEKIQLKYWQWFEIENSNDQGVVQISVNSGGWQTISSPEFEGTSMVWTQYVTDLSDYAGSSVRIAFYFTSDFYWNYTGWYIDDISIENEIVTFINPEGFELGIGNWSADNGLWEVGIPTVGPDDAHSGQHCAGTVLDGTYPNYANTRLISPEFTINPVMRETPMLFFYHWYIIENSNDIGVIQISLDGGEWQTISDIFTGTNETWSQYGLNLSDYINLTVRLAFYFTSDFYWNYAGWYIDDVRIEGATVSINEHIVGSNNPSFILHQNYPNPFKDQTTISFEVMENAADINLSVYNSFGQLVKSLVNSGYKKGDYSLTWNGHDESGKKTSPGIYFLKLESEKYSETMRIAIIN